MRVTSSSRSSLASTEMVFVPEIGFVAAEACGRDDIGSIAVGKRADCIVVRGDPSVDIAAIAKIVAVYKDGAVVHANPS